MKDVANNCHGNLTTDKSKHKLSMNQYFTLLYQVPKLYREIAAYQTPKYLTGALIITATMYFAKRSQAEWRKTKNKDWKVTAFDNKRAVTITLGYGIKNKHGYKQSQVCPLHNDILWLLLFVLY